MRRSLVASTPITLSIFLLFVLLSILAAGAAAARPIENLELDRPATDQAALLPPVLPDAADNPDSPAATLEIQVNYGHEWVAGVTDAWETVVVTVTDEFGALKNDAVVIADEAGDFFVGCDDWFSGQCEDIVPGDVVQVFAAGLLNAVNPVGTIGGLPDGAENTVGGWTEVGVPGGTVDVRCEVWEDPGPSPIAQTVATGNDTFQCDFDDVGWDLERGQMVALRYYEPDGDQVINMVEWPWMRVNYGHDWVAGNYPAGRTVAITVTDSIGAVKGTALVNSDYGQGWGESEGFNTDWSHWSPAQPDIQADDLVHFGFENGYTKTLEVGDIGGSVNAASDSVSGPINASGGVSLPVECHPWGAWEVGIGDAPVKNSWAEPDGSVPYTCAWDPATEWDVQPGQDIGVMYIEPDDDRIINVLREPGPYLRLSQQTEGEAGESGNYLFHIDYWNDGDGSAENVVFTSTLVGMTYLVDTSPFAVTVAATPDGEIVELDMGALTPGSGGSFDLFVQVTEPVSSVITNTMNIATTTFDQGEPWEKEAVWVGHVENNDTHLSVDKWAWTGDPAPGEEFIFTINVCNNGSTASSDVTLEDNFQAPAMSLQSWKAHQAGWVELYSDPATLELSYPSVPGYSCREVHARVLLDSDVAPGENLENLAIISAVSDLETEDNEAHWVGAANAPHLNLRVDKWWNSGVLAPGGELSYGVGYGNDGNVPSGPFLITETLPAGTSFISAWHNDPFGGYDFPPDIVTTDYVAWEITNLDNGFSGDFEVRLGVDAGASSGPLTNEVFISSLPAEDSYDDNGASWTEFLNGPGPNLRIKKWHWWENEGRLNYSIRYENIGDQTVDDIWITDELPAGIQWDGETSGFDWDQLVTWDYINGTRTLLWNYTDFGPGESRWIHVGANLDSPGEPARWYTNTVDITIPDGDVNPSNNDYQDVAFSGGEVRRVEFWFHNDGSADIWGEAVPGYPVTITLPGGQFYVFADPNHPECSGCWNLDTRVPLSPGDSVSVIAGPGQLPVNFTTPNPIEAAVDSTADEVFGQIGGWIERPVEVHGQWPNGYRETTSDGAGNFLAAYSDIPRGGRGYIRFIELVNYAQVIFHRPFWDPELVLETNYGHDWIQGYYEPGHTIWITVTEPDGATVKGLAELTSTEEWWDGEPGFSTDWSGWLGDRPDLQADDWVFTKADNGYENAVQLGDLDFSVDFGTDIVSGNLFAPVPEPEVHLRCELWNHPTGPGIDDMVDPKGGAISCDFGSAGYDIAPGNAVAVMYWEGDGDQILNTQEWPSIRAIIGPNSGGNRDIWGHGAEPGATVEVTVTDEFGGYVAGETVIADDQGNWNTNYLPEGSLDFWNWVEIDFGNSITDAMQIYHMDGVANPHTDVVSVTADAPALFNIDLQYCSRDDWCETFSLGEIGQSGFVSANLMTDFGVDVQWGDRVEAVLNVWNGHQLYYAWLLAAPDLGVWKWPVNGYARPGSVFPYGVSYVNQGNGPAENVVIVDTLPPGTTYVGDTSGFPVTLGPGDEVSWELGTVDPDASSDFLVTVAVLADVTPGEGAIGPNCVEILTSTAGDWNPENDSNCAGPVDVWEDEVEIGVQKWSEPDDPHQGQEFDYRIEYCNYRGAAAGPVVLTDTLPAGVSLLDWWVDDWFEPWQPLAESPNELVLEALSLPGDRCGNLTLRVLLDADAAVGTSLENWIEISVADDVWLDNNWQLEESTHASPERYDLWVGKSRNDGILVPGGYASFSVDYNNQGNLETTVRITDTLPPGFNYVEGWWAGSTPWSGQPIPDPAISGNQLVWDLPAVPVNGQHGFNIVLEIDAGVDPGPLLENCAAIAADGPDDYPANNESCVTFTVQPPGPNLWVDKWHWWNGDGQLQYQLNFANIGDQLVSDVWVTDTLPGGTQWDGWWDMGFEWERLVSGEVIVDGGQLIWHFTELYPGEWGWIQFSANLDEPGTPLRWYTNTVAITMPPGETAPDDNFDMDSAFSGGEVSWVDLNVYGTSIWGYAPRGPIRIQTSQEEAFLEWDGDFQWDFEKPFLPGDMIVVTAGGGAAPVTIVIPDPFDVEASSMTKHVSGQVDHLDSEWLEVDLYEGPTLEVQTDSNGFFDVFFSDISRAAEGEVRYRTQIDYADVTFHRSWRTPDLFLQVDYGRDRVEGLYEAGHTVWITVTESDGVTVKGTAELYTGVFPWWSGGTGFSTEWHGWTDDPPDILPGDWVYGLVDNGYEGEIRVFTIDALVDVSGDYVMGTLDAPWYVGVTDFMDVDCIPWGAWDQGISADLKHSFASPDGSTSFQCEWDPATEWDVDYYQDIDVQAYEPDGDSVLQTFVGEAVDLGVNTWAMNSAARPGGVAVYGIWYQNNGNIPGENSQIVATLPAHTSYADDTSGLPVTIGPGNTVTWNLGQVKPAEFILFRLTLNVDASAPVGADVIDPNHVTISTTSAPLINPGDDEAWSEAMEVQTDNLEIELGVDKWVWPEDPAPGQIFFYTIEWCNNRSTAAGPAVLTDTLPSQATLLEWHEGEWWNNYWSELSFDGSELVLYAPGLPGDACWQIVLVMQLNAETSYDTTLVNEAVLSVDGDVYSENDYVLNDAAVAGSPRYNLEIAKQFHNGQVYPGGWVNYFIEYRNSSNITTSVVITESVPPGLVFDGAWWGGGQEGENALLPDPVSFGNLLIWELGELAVGEGRWFHVQFGIDPDMPVGTEFGNCVTIAGDGPDDRPDDNEHCMSVLANPEGPNLKVAKRHWWPNEGQISYEITFWNIGSESFFDVPITDTMPVGVSAANEPSVDYHSPVHIIDNTAAGQWVFVVEELNPGDRGAISFDVNLDDPELFPAWYTNTVDITIPSGDVDPGDNHYEDLAGKIPDTVLRVTPPDVQLSAGDTFTVEVEIENVTDMGGIALELTFDPAVIEVVDSDTGVSGVQILPGECPLPDLVLVNEADNGAGTVNYDAVSVSGSCSGTGVVLRIPVRAIASGTSPIHFSTWAPINSDGFDIPLFVEDGQIEVSDLGLLQGQVELQGRRNHSGAEVCVEDGFGSQTCALTDAGGYYAFWLPTGLYTVTVEKLPYLGGVKHDVPVSDGNTTRLAQVKLLGGDAVDDGHVNIQDLAKMGGLYLSFCGDGSYQPQADVNADCVVDIRDMVIAGANFDSAEPVVWP